MSIDYLNTALLKRILALQVRREEISSELSKVEGEIQSLISGAPAAAPKAARRGRPPKAAKAVKAPKAPKAPKAAKPAKRGRKPGRKAAAKVAAPKAEKPAKVAKASAAKGGRARGKRGETGRKILALLKNTGKSGITVKEISEKLKMPPQNLFVWFNTTGKKTPGISKVAPATYRLDG